MKTAFGPSTNSQVTEIVIVDQTALIIGAGASTEYRLPAGTELKHQIQRLLDIRFERLGEKVSCDHVILEALHLAERNRENRGNVDPYLHAARQIRDAMPQAQSIDNYLDVHDGDEKIRLCGKLAITRAILNAEKSSSLYFSRENAKTRLNFTQIQDTWLNKLFQVISENCRADGLPERFRRLQMVVFNYDRCIEHFIHEALQNYYRVSPEEAASLVAEIDIYHPYGKVGNLPWETTDHAMQFGGDPHPTKLLELADQIRTFTEGTDPNSSKITDLRKSLGSCTMFVFLGFAFHPLNMKLIAHSNETNSPKRVFATAKGISKFDCETIKNDISRVGIAPFEVLEVNNSVTCNDLFSEYWRTLALSFK